MSYWLPGGWLPGDWLPGDWLPGDDDVDIRSGGVVAVDTESLRGVADGYGGLGVALADVCETLRGEFARLSTLTVSMDWPALRADMLASRAASLRDSASRLTDGLRLAAAVYELVEARAAVAAAEAGGDAGAIADARLRLDALARADPAALALELVVDAHWRMMAPDELARQARSSPLSDLGAAGMMALGLTVALVGRGRVAQGAVLTGGAPPVEVTLLDRGSRTVAPPASLADVVGRVPQGDARVKVERYDMRDGSQRFAVYVAGTQLGGGSREPWDMTSNLQLYSGQRSASYEATAEALRQAGAKPGDAVYAVGHSQGAMVAGHLALQEGYDVKALVSVGSPISVDVADSTLSVQLRHVDDPVAALADGGQPAPVGAPGSFVAERVTDPAPGLQDLKLAPHLLDEYIATAALLDDSDDPRMGAIREALDELGDAASVEVFEYAASRPEVSPSGAAGGG